MGEDLGDGPSKFEVGDGTCIRPSQYFRSTVNGMDVRLKRFRGGIFSPEIKVFG